MTDDDRNANVLPLYPKAPLLSSDRTQWSGLHLEYHQQPPHQVPENALNESQIIIHTQQLLSPLVEYLPPQRFEFEQTKPGDITVIPAHVYNGAIWEKECHFILLKFNSTLFEQYTPERISTSNPELIPSFSRADPLIYGIGWALKSELENHESENHLYVESLTTTLVTHLLRHYSTQKLINLPLQGLSQQQLKQVMAYIDHHLDQNLTLMSLAAIAHLSPSYFSALFKQSTGLTPHQYVIQCRINRAKQLLLQGMSVAEVALNLGFSHQSHLSRHFKRLVGVTPKEFLKRQSV
ncbi:helix-turn-helix transcriptional regulator [Oscillatoria sp. FACHB-1407]|uniref:helix-turn-helix transcriptional regulator n=1 Tax=Oscillatoria sp. FACHB-1407 TaxID=2692847 RepID=UPI0018EF53EC|nr:AraC family transcriptional regulator [Oscillatoria sp. FACHB-1407]